MHRSKWSRFALIIAAAALAGCSRTGTPTGSDGNYGPEQAEISSALSSTPDLIDDGQMESSDVGLVKAGPSFDGAVAAIRPYRFWRQIDDVTRRFEFAFTDTDSVGRPTKAMVTVHKVLRGSFNIAAGQAGVDTAGSDTTARRLIKKPLVDHWVRRMLIVRIPRRDTTASREARERGMWKVAGTSGVEVMSATPAEGAHAQIQSIQIQSGSLDTMITAPREFFRLRNVLKLQAGAEVTVTVTTLAADDVVILMARNHRRRFEHVDGNTYVGHWTLADERGVRHFGVNVLSNDTLFDDAAPYNSHAWMFPYAVVGEDIAEYRP